MAVYFNKIIIALLLTLNVSLIAQNDDVSVIYHQVPGIVKDTLQRVHNDGILRKIAVGGMLSLNVGTYTYIDLSPDISYHFNKYFAVGVGGTYIFAYDNFDKTDYHVFGARAFVEGHFLNYIGLYAAYQVLNFVDPRPRSLDNRIWSNNISLGGGYYQRSERFSTYAFILYNRSDREGYNIYGNLLIKVGFNVFLK